MKDQINCITALIIKKYLCTYIVAAIYIHNLCDFCFHLSSSAQ